MTYYFGSWCVYARSQKSNGVIGEACEMAARSFTSRRLVKRVKRPGEPDAWFTWTDENGLRHKVSIEYKTACGKINNADQADYIAYWPEPQEDIEVQDGFVMFTNEEWQEFLTGFTGRGQLVKVSANGERHIQSFRCLFSDGRPKASLPLANYIHEACDGQPTLREFVKAMRGQAQSLTLGPEGRSPPLQVQEDKMNAMQEYRQFLAEEEFSEAIEAEEEKKSLWEAENERRQAEAEALEEDLMFWINQAEEAHRRYLETKDPEDWDIYSDLYKDAWGVRPRW